MMWNKRNLSNQNGDHLVGSRSTSGIVDLDPGSKKNCDKLAYKTTKIIRI